MSGKFWYWERAKPRGDLRRDYQAIEERAEAAGILPVLRAFQNDLVYAFDDLMVAPDGRLTFYGKRRQSTFVPLMAIVVDAERPAILAEFEPSVLLAALGIEERMLPELTAVLPEFAHGADVPGTPAAIIAIFRDAAQVVRLARFLGHRYGALGGSHGASRTGP